MTLAVVVNRAAGLAPPGRGPSLEERLRAAFARAGIAPRLEWTSPAGLPRTLRQVLEEGATRVAVGGGDGTLNAAANALLGSGGPGLGGPARPPAALAVLPLGTFNHFAADAGIPGDLEGAVRLLAEGEVRQVDVGEVNGRLFLNNLSMGLYPYAVRRRDVFREQLGLGKAAAMGAALMAVLWRLPHLEACLVVDGAERRVHAPFLFVGNNRYETAPLAPIVRRSLSEGRLGLVYTGPLTRLGVLRVVLRTLVGRLEGVPDLHQLPAREMTLHSPRRRLRVALDGEVLVLRPPLAVRVRPAALPLVLPREAP